MNARETFRADSIASMMDCAGKRRKAVANEIYITVGRNHRRIKLPANITSAVVGDAAVTLVMTLADMADLAQIDREGEAAAAMLHNTVSKGRPK